MDVDRPGHDRTKCRDRERIRHTMPKLSTRANDRRLCDVAIDRCGAWSWHEPTLCKFNSDPLFRTEMRIRRAPGFCSDTPAFERSARRRVVSGAPSPAALR
jgi:hypothetical protein